MCKAILSFGLFHGPESGTWVLPPRREAARTAPETFRASEAAEMLSELSAGEATGALVNGDGGRKGSNLTRYIDGPIGYSR